MLVTVKRTGDAQPAIEDTDNEEKRSRLGFKPDDVKQAEEDQSAVVHTEVRETFKQMWTGHLEASAPTAV